MNGWRATRLYELLAYFFSPYTATTLVLFALYALVILHCASEGDAEASLLSHRTERGVLRRHDGSSLSWASITANEPPLAPANPFGTAGEDGAVASPAVSVLLAASSSRVPGGALAGCSAAADYTLVGPVDAANTTATLSPDAFVVCERRRARSVALHSAGGDDRPVTLLGGSGGAGTAGSSGLVVAYVSPSAWAAALSPTTTAREAAVDGGAGAVGRVLLAIVAPPLSLNTTGAAAPRLPAALGRLSATPRDALQRLAEYFGVAWVVLAGACAVPDGSGAGAPSSPRDRGSFGLNCTTDPSVVAIPLDPMEGGAVQRQLHWVCVCEGSREAVLVELYPHVRHLLVSTVAA